MDPQKMPQPPPDTPANAEPSTTSSDALDNLTAGQTIKPDSTVSADDQDYTTNQVVPSAPITLDTNAPHLHDNSQPAPLPVTSEPKKKGLIIGVLAAAILVLGGGVAAANYYIQNKPANILKRALASAFDQDKTKTVQFSGAVNSGEASPGLDLDIIYQGQVDSQNKAFNLSGKLDALVTKVTFDARSADGKTFYLKFGGLDGLAALFGATGAGANTSIYESLGTALNDQWLEVNDSLAKQVSGGSFKNEKLSDADRQKLLDAYAQHPFVVIKEVLPDEVVKGANSYHYKLVIDKTRLKDFALALKSTNLSGLKMTQTQLENFSESVARADFNKYPIEIWIAKSSKMVSQVVMKIAQDGVTLNFRLTVDSYNQPVTVEKPEGAKSILDILGGFLGSEGASSDLLMPGLGAPL